MSFSPVQFPFNSSQEQQIGSGLSWSMALSNALPLAHTQASTQDPLPTEELYFAVPRKAKSQK